MSGYLPMSLALGFDSPKGLVVLHQKRDEGIGSLLLTSATAVIEGAEYHFHRNPLKRLTQGNGDLLSDVHQYGIEDQGGIQLNLHTIDPAYPEVG